MNYCLFLRGCLLAGCFLSWNAQAVTPEWIWSSKNNTSTNKEVRFFRKTFSNAHPLIKAELTASGDDSVEIFINGKKVAETSDWGKPAFRDVVKNIVEGENVIAARAVNSASLAGVIVRLEMTQATLGSARQKFDPSQHAGLRWISVVVSDGSWVCSDREQEGWNTVHFEATNWLPAASVGKLGDQPWGDIFKTREATPISNIEVEPGFKVELLHSATPTESSWICMAVDPKGRLIISPQNEKRLFRVELSHGKFAGLETLPQPIGSAMGLLYADKSLFVNGDGPKGMGIYRMRDDGDHYEAPVMIHELEKSTGEHGSHGLVLGPDHKLYIVSGNFTHVPDDILRSSPHKNYADDQLLPRAEDGNGFGAGLLPPGGFVIRMDLDGKNCELFAAGTRNTYDIAFNADGELFGFDSDMEWDWGTAWYRPIRINHWVSGGDYGFREGTGKFPEYYEDTLPATLDVGVGSPTGVKFGTDSNFPEKYRKAFFMLDWSYGRIFAAHLEPAGATYHATLETILRGKPLNLTDFEFGKDGAMYFITGGRNTESGLYRLSYVGGKIQNPKSKIQRQAEEQGRQARKLRHDLEFFHGQRDPRIVDVVWPLLNSDDRWIQYAARIALEFQDVSWWKDRALAETNTEGGLTALLALARCGGKETQHDLLLALKKFPLHTLDEHQELLKLRVIELSFCRQGRPSADLANLAIEKLDPLYPAASFQVNRELCQLLLYLRAPDAVSKTMDLLDKAATQEEQTWYVLHLRDITNSWTLDERRDYLGWFDKNRDHIQHPPEIIQYFKDAGRDYSDGASFPKFLANFRSSFTNTLDADERVALADLLVEKTNVVAAAGPMRFVQNWKMQDIQPDLDKTKHGRSFKKGKKAFIDTQCVQCHRFGDGGGSVGPELTAVSSRLSSRDILESILEPSKVVSEQYQNTDLTLKNGDDITGRVVEENNEKLIIMTDPRKLTKVEVRKTDIETRRASKLSPMPEGLVNGLTKNEILDLIAYLQSGGKKQDQAFRK